MIAIKSVHVPKAVGESRQNHIIIENIQYKCRLGKQALSRAFLTAAGCVMIGRLKEAGMRELTEKFLFTLSLCDRNGYWLPSQILMMMQEMGGRHGQTLGVGRAEMLAKNAVWVLTRNEYRLLRLPRPGELIVAKTHPGPARRTLYPRYHTFELEDGTPLAEGIGGWTLCDVSTRRMAHLPEVAGLIRHGGSLQALRQLPFRGGSAGRGDRAQPARAA